MRSGRRRLTLVLGGAILAGWLVLRPDRDQTTSPVPDSPPGAATTAAPRSHARLAGEWRDLIARCEGQGDPRATQKLLAETKERWLLEDPQVLAGAIGQLLRDGGDATTGISFETGPGGALRGWPTLRVFMLDVLSVTDPDLAGVIAREVLDSTTSAEEFAVALKPLMLGGPWQAPAAELEARFARLLGQPEWQQRVGLAEALDLSRAAAAPGTTAILANWVDRSPPAQEAGIMALHETAAREPALVTSLLASDRELFAEQPELRASLLARASVSDPQQASVVADYLKDPAVPIAEKQQFLELFPLRSASTGYRLFGSPPAPFDAATVRADDRAALEIVTGWKNDPALAPLQSGISTLEARLQAWITGSQP